MTDKLDWTIAQEETTDESGYSHTRPAGAYLGSEGLTDAERVACTAVQKATTAHCSLPESLVLTACSKGSQESKGITIECQKAH